MRKFIANTAIAMVVCLTTSILNSCSNNPTSLPDKTTTEPITVEQAEKANEQQATDTEKAKASTAESELNSPTKKEDPGVAQLKKEQLKRKDAPSGVRQ